jgi:hypothetical protein
VQKVQDIQKDRMQENRGRSNKRNGRGVWSNKICPIFELGVFHRLATAGSF